MPTAIDTVHILESVLIVWREEGYQRATTRKVAALAGISEMTLFRRFGEKAALFRAAMELEAERFTAQAIGHSGDLEADLERIVRAYAALLDRSAPIFLDFLLEAPRNPDLSRIRGVPLAAIVKVVSIITALSIGGPSPPRRAVPGTAHARQPALRGRPPLARATRNGAAERFGRAGERVSKWVECAALKAVRGAEGGAARGHQTLDSIH